MTNQNIPMWTRQWSHRKSYTNSTLVAGLLLLIPQFIYLGNEVVSHIQVRGTVPLFWEQPGIQVGSHKIQFSRGLDLSMDAFERHLMSIVSHYGATAIVNLLGSKQGEAMLSHQYQELHKQSAFKVSVLCPRTINSLSVIVSCIYIPSGFLHCQWWFIKLLFAIFSYQYSFWFSRALYVVDVLHNYPVERHIHPSNNGR